MTEIQDLPVPRHDAKLLLEDLACVCGTLSEIMTAWRRAMPWRPELPLSILTALQDTTRQLAADIATAGRAGQRLDPALSVAERFSVLKEVLAEPEVVVRAGRQQAGQEQVAAGAMRRRGERRGGYLLRVAQPDREGALVDIAEHIGDIGGVFSRPSVNTISALSWNPVTELTVDRPA